MEIQIYRYLERTKMAGFGWRFCLWVQGCSRRCEGCMAEKTWSHSDGITMCTEEIWKQIATTPDIEGVTFLGGEPFEQAQAVAILAQRAQTMGLSVLTFTGFTYEELIFLDHLHIRQLLDATDLLIDGSFSQEQFDLQRPWVGSSNQQFHFLSDRYKESDLKGIHNQVEVRIAANGKALINGMGDFSKIRELL